MAMRRHWNQKTRETNYYLDLLLSLQTERLGMIGRGEDTTSIDADIASAESGLSSAVALGSVVGGFISETEADFDDDPTQDFGVFMLSGGTVMVSGVEYRVDVSIEIFIHGDDLAVVLANIDEQVPEEARATERNFTDEIFP